MHEKIALSVMSVILTVSFLNITPVLAEDSTPSLLDNNDLLSDYAYIVDMDTDQVLVDKNSSEQIYPASLTKMMTCIIAMENLTDPDQTVLITDEMLDGLYEAEASVAGFEAGDEPTVEDLFYGSALPSGADASNALAITTAGSINAFVQMMNEKAAQLGMNSTHFMNVTGLHDPDHYTTARDLNKLLQYAVNNTEFVKVFSTDEYITSPLASAPDGLYMYSTTYLSAIYGGFDLDGMTGSKTGYTPEAERCLAYWANVNDMNIAAVTAHAVQTDEHYYPHVEDAVTVLNALKNWQKMQTVQTGDIVKTITVRHWFGHTQNIDVTSRQDITIDLPDNAVVSIDTDLPDETDSSYADQLLNGNMTVSYNGEVISTSPLSVEIPADPNFFARFIKRIRAIF